MPILIYWAMTSPWLLAAGSISCFLWLLLRPSKRYAKRWAEPLRAIPYFGEPFTFIADRQGARDVSPSGSSSLAWSRYERVELDDDQVILILDNSTIRMLPKAALTSDHTPEQAVEILSSWIESARAESPAGTGGS